MNRIIDEVRRGRKDEKRIGGGREKNGRVEKDK